MYVFVSVYIEIFTDLLFNIRLESTRCTEFRGSRTYDVQLIDFKIATDIYANHLPQEHYLQLKGDSGTAAQNYNIKLT